MQNLFKILSLSCCSVNLFALSVVADQQNDKPNVVFIVADDHGYADMSCLPFAAKDVQTPNLDRLAKRGITFTQGYSASPICSPARLSLMTGRYPQPQNGFWYGVKGLPNRNEKDGLTIAELLKNEGYATGMVGKVHYGGGEGNLRNRSFPLNHGFDYFFGFSGSPMGRKHYLIHSDNAEKKFQESIKHSPLKKPGKYTLRMESMLDGQKRIDIKGFSTELFGARAREFVRKNAAKPFFLNLSFNAIHDFTNQLPKEYLKKHGIEPYPDWDPAKEPIRAWTKKFYNPNLPQGRSFYLGQLYYMDKEIGKLLDELKKLDILENTIIVYLSDNGGATNMYANNAPLNGGEVTVYEGGLRIPFIVAYPKKFRKEIIDDTVISSLDLFPTICRLTGISAEKLPTILDGKDLTPLLSGTDTATSHKTLFWDMGFSYAVRDGNWKLKVTTRTPSENYAIPNEKGTFLYNLASDPGELENLAEGRPEVMKKLQLLHEKWRENNFSMTEK